MAKSMTSRERVLAAISHEQPDTIPVDLGGISASGIVVEEYEKLTRHLGLATENELLDRMMRVVKVGEPLLKKLDIDTRSLYRGASTSDVAKNIGPREYQDEWGVRRVHPENSYYYDIQKFPLGGDIAIQDIVI